jgi:hypothetical protein
MSKINELLSKLTLGIETVDGNGMTNLQEKLFVVEKALELVEDLAGVPSGISVEESNEIYGIRRQVREFRVKLREDGRFDLTD